MNEGFTRILMPGLRMPSHQMGHPVMGEIGPRRTAVFIDVVFLKSLFVLNELYI